MLIGYVRVSTQEQNEQRQIVALKEKNVDKIFTDKASGKNTEREALKGMHRHHNAAREIHVDRVRGYGRIGEGEYIATPERRNSNSKSRRKIQRKTANTN